MVLDSASSDNLALATLWLVMRLPIRPVSLKLISEFPFFRHIRQAWPMTG